MSRGLRSWCQGSGFRVQISDFRVQGSGFRVQGSGFRVQGSGFRGWGCYARSEGTSASRTPCRMTCAGPGPDLSQSDRKRASISNFMAMKFAARILYYY
jgi:hypothetical protein